MQLTLPRLITVLFVGASTWRAASLSPPAQGAAGEPDWLVLVQTVLAVHPAHKADEAILPSPQRRAPGAADGPSLGPAVPAAVPVVPLNDSKLQSADVSWPGLVPPFSWQPQTTVHQPRGKERADAVADGGTPAAQLAGRFGFGYYSDALVCFFLAITTSWVLGGRLALLSNGILPQISGFLFMGIMMGPYCTNILSEERMALISDPINRICLSFIAGAAGVEMYLPELRSRLGAMALQVLFISLATLVIVFIGFFLLTKSVLMVPVIEMQATATAKIVIVMLISTLMTARSPASAIAVIAELGCGELKAAKVCLGVTVCSDVVVLVLFAIVTQLVRVVTKGGGFGPMVLLSVVLQLVVSVLLGAVASLLFRFIIPAAHNKVDEEGPAQPWRNALTWMRGALVIGIMYAGSEVSVHMGAWSHEFLRLEPLLVCAAACCVAGHDESRRAGLIESLMSWTQYMVLPFFTLTGATLDMPGLLRVFPAAASLAVLRLISIAVGSTGAGLLSSRLNPGMKVTHTEVGCTWLTLVAQAGVTLGLVLEVKQSFGGAWADQLGTLVTSVVVLNQLLGPILCRLGLKMIIRAEEESNKDPHEATPDSPFETK